jgi:2-polyprenyl-3-methyl-5-hydroxy-6-metoxy-1,4-benzoquinol methylase
MSAAVNDVEARARLSLGASDERICQTVADALAARQASGTIADVGCGAGNLWSMLRGRFTRCIALDVVRYEQLPADVDFRQADLDAGLPLADASVDAAAAVEVIEHLENPRAFVRELARVVRPGGWVALSTPNQLSALSLLTLVLKGSHSAFQESDYPAHRTALLEIDLRRILTEAGLRDIEVRFTGYGRLPLSARHYPRALAALAPRRFSDNVVVVARR